MDIDSWRSNNNSGNNFSTEQIKLNYIEYNGRKCTINEMIKIFEIKLKTSGNLIVIDIIKEILSKIFGYKFFVDKIFLNVNVRSTNCLCKFNNEQDLVKFLCAYSSKTIDSYVVNENKFIIKFSNSDKIILYIDGMMFPYTECKIR